MTSLEPYQAHVEDYHSDDSDGGPVTVESFPRRSSPTAQANVSTKRSKDLNAEKAPVLEKMAPNSDMRSDSGYSSITAASKSSADSAPSASSRSPPAVPVTAAPPVSQSPAPKARRQTTVGGEVRHHSNESSPRQSHKPLSRTASVSSKSQRPAHQRRPTITRERRDTKDAECRDPNCTDCGLNTLPPRARRPELQQTASTRNVAGYPSETMSQRSDPNPYYSPPSPVYNRQPAPYASQGPAVVQTARTRRSSSTAGTRPPRPQSFAGEPSSFWAPGMPAPYPSPPQERGPPPSFSAYQSMQNMPNMQHLQYPHHIPPYMGAQQGGYYPQQAQQFDSQQRPPLSARGSSSYGHSQPPPIITQDDTSKYSARYGQPPTPNEQHYNRGANPTLPKPKLLQYGEPDADEDSSSDSEYTEDEEHEREVRQQQQVRAARALMPPPKMKRDQSQRRPALTHAKTTQVVERLENDRRDKRRQSIVVPDRAVPRERQRERAPTVSAAPSRRPSVSRPPVHRSTQSEYDTRQARIVVNDSRNNRRKSYQVYDKTYDDFVRDRVAEEQYKAERQREKRASRVLMQEQYIPGQYEEDESEEEAPRVLPHRQRAKTESDPRKGKARTVEVKNKKAELSAEEYINATRGSRDPYADQISKVALKRASRKPSLPSDSGSSQSNGSGRASQSNRTTMTSATNNEIRLRVDGTMPLSLQLSGDMEGRTLQLVPAEGGMTDLVIGGGNARGNDSVYRSERGTVQVNNNRRSLIAGQGRRDAEDASERSTRSARSRRDRDEIREIRDERAPILRRTRPTTTYRN
ncbi:hypothetical protein HBI56_220250 [Parastagonospora nodorum]|nr:hypothetical protein HBH53_220460 [Parastagonospora nodorum]KAH3960034.1 hypothetical protein HBH52_238640 [Parastagonospora nodorum]KAH3991500.1 hypothetical protein HBI10_232140 [Parastagonospora nodorum]KAH4009273.1 hypothetical protein HBI13_222940 [Parastagonospora nodorum]KAH4234698.1 hypothetical protein HBI06_063100 [Parastagonospora nodorum]